MGSKLTHAPVYFTLAQVRFNAVLNLENYLPEIQDHLRREHYPDFTSGVLHQVPIPSGRDQGVTIPQSAITRYTFGNIEQTSGFTLDSNALSFQTTAYETFESFMKQFLMGIKALHSALDLDFTERVGLRYLDAVIPRDGESLSDYLIPEVLGLSSNFPGKLMHTFSETTSKDEDGQLISRTVIQDAQVGIPPGVTLLQPKVNDRFDYSGQHAVLDIDAFNESRVEFDLDNLERNLHALHDKTSKSFYTVVTKHALTAWK